MKTLLKRALRIHKYKKFHKTWNRAVSFIASVVVFVTTYALILPALTLESGAAMCGMETHQHSDDCYEEFLVCEQEESDGHRHDDECYDVYTELVCEIEEHKHKDSCFDEEGNLVCEEEEHVHSDDCFQEVFELACGEEESKGHQHNSKCYETVLVCEKEVHTHSEKCYIVDKKHASDDNSEATSEVTDEGNVEGTADEVYEEINNVIPEAVAGEAEAIALQDMMQEFKSGTLTAEDRTYVITMDYTAEAQIPDKARLSVREITAKNDRNSFEEYLTQAEQTVAETVEDKINVDKEATRFFDIEILVDDENGDTWKIEPAAPVNVRIQIPDAAAAAENKNQADPTVLHFVEEGIETIEATAGQAVENAAAKENGKDNKKSDNPLEGVESTEIRFEAGSFSVYGIVYTVDFHWEVDGKEYQYSIPGGGFASFYDLVEALGIEKDRPDTEKDEVKEFVNGIEDIEFSAPELVDVVKVGENLTIAEIRDILGVEYQYSAELTEEQIRQIDEQMIMAGDWGLISLKPFTTEETLTVTMKGGDQWTIRVTDAQITANVLAADGERFRITVTYDDNANIPDGSELVAKEILEGTEEFEKYLTETAEKWEEDDRDGVFSKVRFFDIEIKKDGKKIEPEAPVEVEITHEDGFTIFEDETLRVIHFAENGTEIIEDLQRNENGTEVVYEQNGFSVIGTVTTVKSSGWPTSNGQHVLVLQDGDDYYALKHDGTLEKVRFFNNTVSFVGEGTTTTEYISDYLWYVQSYSGANAKGRISDKYYDGSSTADQNFIAPTKDGWLVNSARQINFNAEKQMLYYTYYYESRTLSARNGHLSTVALDDPAASPMYFASASSFTANSNVTDLFTQEEVESIIEKWKEQKTSELSYDKTAEVYDYENRIYQVDLTASSSDYEVSPSIALDFVVDASRSMYFPTSITEVGTFNGTNASNVRDWINAHGNTNQVYFVIQDKNGKATQYAIFFDPNSTYQEKVYGRTVTRYGQWLWCDASNYNPPDDTANGGSSSSRRAGDPLSSWSATNMNDGKIYTTDITGSSNGTYGTRKTWVSRIEYLKQCVRVASQVIYAVDEDAQIGLIGFNSTITDYGTFGKAGQQDLLNKIDNISLAGGTNHQGGLQKAIDKYQNRQSYAAHYAKRKHVVVLVTDGAPNASGVNWTTIGKVATTLKNLKDDFGNKTELYTMGLSLSNVGSNQEGLFGISSGDGYKYAAEDAAQIVNAVTKMVDAIFVQANLVADVKDVIDPAFYPVNKADGRPLAENDWINLEGKKVNAGANDAAGQIRKDSSTGNWYVEWKDQNIDWPTTDESTGAVVEPGWHGTVFVKAKEDFLGGNGISTNAEGSQLEAKKYIVHGETTPHDLPEGDHTEEFATPYVNVDELDITNNSTEWTVYLGTNVDPLKEVKALWEEVKVKEVVTKTESDHRIAADGEMTYEYQNNANDGRNEVNGREEFHVSDLEGVTLTDEDWADLIAGNEKIVDYNAYGHSKVGTIMIKLTQEVKEGEKNLLESPHDTAVTGTEVEKYTLTVSYRPAGANISNWHTGSYGTGMAGSRAGEINKDNTHIINVFAKGLQITKVDIDDHILTGAKFALYRTAREGETDLMEINGGQYFKLAELDTSSTGIAVKEQIERLKDNEQYYLVETQTPEGYVGIDPIPVKLNVTDIFTPKPGEMTQPTQPETGFYDWNQTASLKLDAEYGVKRTNADNTEDLTHSGTDNSENETVYYRVINNPGFELPHTGGPGTTLIHLLGIMLTGLAGACLVLKQRQKKEA